MTIKKIIAIVFIFMMTAIAWMILGGANSVRTKTLSNSLKTQVANLYGGKLNIESPKCFSRITKHKEETVNNTIRIVEYFENNYHELINSDIKIDVYLDQRKKGNMWFPTFKAEFKGEYIFQIDESSKDDLFIYSTLNSSDAIYNNLYLKINNEDIDNVLPLINKQEIPVIPLSDNTVKLMVSYSATGMEDLYYLITTERNAIAQINNFKLVLSTDFDLYDFPSNMMSPTTINKTDNRNELIWELNKTITGKNIGLLIPNKLNPGEIITRVSFFAPVSLLFFFIRLVRQPKNMI